MNLIQIWNDNSGSRFPRNDILIGAADVSNADIQEAARRFVGNSMAAHSSVHAYRREVGEPHSIVLQLRRLDKNKNEGLLRANLSFAVDLLENATKAAQIKETPGKSRKGRIEELEKHQSAEQEKAAVKSRLKNPKQSFLVTRRTTRRTLKLTILEAKPLDPIQADHDSSDISASKGARSAVGGDAGKDIARPVAAETPVRAVSLLSRFASTFVRLRMVSSTLGRDDRSRMRRRGAKISPVRSSAGFDTAVVVEADNTGGGEGSISGAARISVEDGVASWAGGDGNGGINDMKDPDGGQSGSHGAEVLRLSLMQEGCVLDCDTHQEKGRADEDEDEDEDEGSIHEEDVDLLRYSSSRAEGASPSVLRSVFRRRDLEQRVSIELVGTTATSNDDAAEGEEGSSSSGGGELVIGSKEVTLRELLRMSRQSADNGGVGSGVFSLDSVGEDVGFRASMGAAHLTLVVQTKEQQNAMEKVGLLLPQSSADTEEATEGLKNDGLASLAAPLPLRWSLAFDAAIEARVDDDLAKRENEALRYTGVAMQDAEGEGSIGSTEATAKEAVAVLEENDADRGGSVEGEPSLFPSGAGRDPKEERFRVQSPPPQTEVSQTADEHESREKKRAIQIMRRRQRVREFISCASGSPSLGAASKSASLYIPDAEWEARRRARQPKPWHSQNSAAIALQRCYRGYAVRRWDRARRASACCLQRRWRGWMQRKAAEAATAGMNKRRQELQRWQARQNRLGRLEGEMAKLRTASAMELHRRRQQDRDDALRTKDLARAKVLHDSRAVQASREQIRRHYHSQPLQPHGQERLVIEEGCCAREGYCAPKSLLEMDWLEREAVVAYQQSGVGGGGDDYSCGNTQSAAIVAHRRRDQHSCVGSAAPAREVGGRHPAMGDYSAPGKGFGAVGGAAVPSLSSSSSSSSSFPVYHEVSAGETGRHANDLATLYQRVMSDTYAKRRLRAVSVAGATDRSMLVFGGSAMPSLTNASIGSTGDSARNTESKRDKFQQIIGLRQEAAALLEERAVRDANDQHILRANIGASSVSELRTKHFCHFRRLGQHLTSLPTLAEMRGHFKQFDHCSSGDDCNADYRNKVLATAAPPLSLPEPTLLLPPTNPRRVEMLDAVNRRTMAALGKQESGLGAFTTSPPSACSSSAATGSTLACPWWSAVLPEDMGGLPRDIRTVQTAKRANKDHGAVQWPFQEWKNKYDTATEDEADALARKSRNDRANGSTAENAIALVGFDEHEASLWWYGWGRRGP